jgi:hypothetical protein
VIADHLRSLECRSDVHDEYNRRVDEAHEGLVWRHPKTSTPDLDDFVVERAARGAGAQIP